MSIQKTYMRYLLTGVLNTIFGILAYLIFIRLGFNYPSALAFSTLLGIGFNYLTFSINVFGFSSKKNFMKYIFNYIFNYLCSIGLISILMAMGLNQNFSGVIIITIMAILNFFILKRYVFT